jgi:hypothetical protein
MHQKPCGLLNVRHYYDKLIDFLDHAVSEHFIKKIHRSIVIVEESPETLLERLEAYKAPEAVKWIDRDSA